MSDIAIHNVDELALLRIGRRAQIDATAEKKERHAGAHWQINRQPTKAQRITVERSEPWPAMRDQPIFVGLEGVQATTQTRRVHLPWPAIIEAVTLDHNAQAVNTEVSLQIAVSGYGSVWHQAGENYQYTNLLGANAVMTNLRWYPGIIIPTPGTIMTVTLIFPATGRGYATVLVKPYRQEVK